jgi:hypothetical protein
VKQEGESMKLFKKSNKEGEGGGHFFVFPIEDDYMVEAQPSMIDIINGVNFVRQLNLQFVIGSEDNLENNQTLKRYVLDKFIGKDTPIDTKIKFNDKLSFIKVIGDKAALVSTRDLLKQEFAQFFDVSEIA